jgi:uncharacterized protein YkwD
MAFGALNTRHLVLVAALLGLLALFVAAGPAAQSASAKGACNQWGDKQSNEVTKNHARKAVMCLINKERDKRGLKDFDHNKKLQEASQNHSDFMQRRHCFSHQCPGEASLTGRLQKVGWLTGGLSAWAYGENIAWGSGGNGTPEKIVKSWMNSSGHRANILSSRFDEIGVGYTKGTISSKKANGAIMTTDFGWKIG